MALFIFPLALLTIGPGATESSSMICEAEFGVGMEKEALAPPHLYKQPRGQKCQDCELRSTPETETLLLSRVETQIR